MKNIKLIIEYDGTKYRGWQRLPDTENTIQGKIEKVLSLMTKEKIEIIGSGRTDAGAHALFQVANFKTNSPMAMEDIKEYCNQYLPEDIVIKDAEEVDERFHSRYNVKGKKYLYRIWNSKTPTAFNRKYTYYLPVDLDVEAMKRGAALLIGSHDFKGFSSVKSKKKSTIREIHSIDINGVQEELQFMIHGNGFLYNMVRIMVGTLLEIGEGKRKVESISSILEGKERSMAGITVPAQGLYLYEVYY